MKSSYDVIVLGVGGIGSATVYELARRGIRVLGLEKFDIPHSNGSSHGVNRIIRLAYNEGPGYVPLLQRAYQLWHALETACGEQLLFKTGSIDTAPEAGRVFAGSLESCLMHKLQYEVLNSREVRYRWPEYRLPERHQTLFQPDGGFLASERCIVRFAELAMGHGAHIHAREPVLEWKPTREGVEVRTIRNEYSASSLILSAGAWTAQQIPALARLAIPERQVLGWFQPAEPAGFEPQRFPVFVAEFEEGHYYGFPVFGIPGFKIGRFHHLRETTHPDRIRREITPEDESVLRNAVARYFPGANGPVMSLRTCMFTNTPDEHFILDRLSEHPQVSIAAGFSGHGFKFCSVVGEIMADLATSGESQHDLSMFRLGRFQS